MTGVVIGSSDLRSVPSGLSHARHSHRESRALHVAPMTWDLQLEASRTVGNGLWRHAMLVFTISNAVITVFTDTFTGVSKVRAVNRLYTDYY